MSKEKRFFKMILPYLPRYWKMTALAVAFMALTAAANAALISLIRLVLDQLFVTPAVSTVTKVPSLLDQWLDWVALTLVTPYADSPFKALLILSGVVIGLTLLKGVFEFLSNYLSQCVTQGFLRDFRNDLFQHLSRLSLDFFSETGTGSLMSRVVNDVELLRQSILMWGRMVSEPLIIAGLLIVALGIHVELTVIAAVVFPFAGLIMALIGRRIQRARRRAQEKLGEISQGLSESFSSIRIVQSFSAEQHEQEKFARRTHRLFKESLKIARLRGVSGPLMEILGAFGVAAILLIGGHYVTRTSTLDGKDFVNLVVAIGLMYQPFKKLSKVYNDFQQGVAAADRIMEVREIQPKIVDRPGAQPLEGFEREVELQDVSFSYDGGKCFALRNINLVASKGSKIALVGPTGAGKSTLVDLLARFYDLTEGSIRIDDKDIRDVTVESLRRLIAFVPQETILFNDTIAANIAYSRPDATQEEIEQVARMAFAHDFILQLPEGYNTVVGERGTALSGGQCQRVSIARALLKRAPILILDEATSALDAESEKIVQRALENLIEHHTTFIIAHRLSTVRHADTILVLNEGQIVGRGTHDELLASNSLYQKLYRLQYFENQQGASARQDPPS